MLDDATRYRVLTTLQENPQLSQRELARQIGISLGKTNYCLKALAHQGLIKIESFRKSSKKSAYLYKLTPSGLAEKSRVTVRFLAHKLKEHEALTEEIRQLREELESSQSRQPDENGG